MKKWQELMEFVHKHTLSKLKKTLKKWRIEDVKEIEQPPYHFSGKELKKKKSSRTLLMHTLINKKEVPKNISKVIILEHNKWSLDYPLYLLERAFLKIPPNSWSTRKHIHEYLHKNGYRLIDEIAVIAIPPHFFLVLSPILGKKTLRIYKKCNKYLEKTFWRKFCRSVIYVGVKNE